MAEQLQRKFFAEKILPLIAAGAETLSKEEVTGFLAMSGYLYSGELMVVGRSPNGWTHGIRPLQLLTSHSREQYSDLIFRSVTSDSLCPMLWVSDQWGHKVPYNTKRSAFWRAVRGVVSDLGIANVEGESWPSHLVWSNLYKVAPTGGGNPGNKLKAHQLKGCQSLLDLELTIYQPRRLLFLTGMDWAEPFVPQMHSMRPPLRSHVKAVGQFCLEQGAGTCVVASHPQGKKESDWVAEVVKAFSL